MDNRRLFSLESNAFEDGAVIPVKYARSAVAGGQNISIPFSWSNAPGNAKSFALAVIDRSANNWVHWIVVDIPADVDFLPLGASQTSEMPSGSRELVNTFGQPGYGGPQPPRGSGVHNYETTIYALAADCIDLAGEVSAEGLERALQDDVIDSARITGKMER